MSFESSHGNPWGAPPPPTALYEAYGQQPSAGLRNRLTERLADPNTQAKAREVVTQIGVAAAKGALEGAGVGEMDEDNNVTVSRWGVMKAVAMPNRTLRKAAQGAVTGAVQEGRGMASQAAEQAISNIDRQLEVASAAEHNAWGAGSETTIHPPATNWGSPAESSWSAAPAAPNAAEAWASAPVQYPSSETAYPAWDHAPTAPGLTESWAAPLPPVPTAGFNAPPPPSPGAGWQAPSPPRF